MILVEYLIFGLYLFFQFIMFSMFNDIVQLDSKVNTPSKGFTAAQVKYILTFWFAINFVIIFTTILNVLFVKRFAILFSIILVSVATIHMFMCAYTKKYVRELKIKETLIACSDRDYDVNAIESYICSYNIDKIYKELILPLHNLIIARDSFKTTEAQEKYDEVVLNKEIEIFVKNLEYVINEEKENHEKVRQQKENIAKISDEKLLDNIKQNYAGLKKYYE